jgi:hypothetical protein
MVLGSIALSMLQTRPLNLSLGRFSVALCRGRMELASASAPLSWHASGAWLIHLPGGNAFVALGPGSSWLPSSQRGSVTVGPAAAAGVTYSLAVVFVPLWPWAILFAGSGLVLWKLSRNQRAGHCKACGYDLRGVRAGPCPECGSAPSPA